MLTAGVTAAVGVAASRLMGLRGFDERTAAAEAEKLLARLPFVSRRVQPRDDLDPLAMTGYEVMAPETPGALPPEELDRPTAAMPTTRRAPSATLAPRPALAASTDWESPLAQERARVAQLLRRATFGYTAAELDQAMSDGFARTVERLVTTPPSQPADLPAAEEAGRGRQVSLQALQTWWLDAMVASPTPFAERMTLFWHGHFASDHRKVRLDNPFLYWQNRMFRSYGLTDLRTLLLEVTKDPAMLRFLDLGVSTAAKPNENYARELMELFTMGAETFSEDDVRAASRALAGWREPRTAAMLGLATPRPAASAAPAPSGSARPAASASAMPAMTARPTPTQRAMPSATAAPARSARPTATPTPPDTVRTGVFEPSRAYQGPPLTFLGKAGVFDTPAVIDRILEQEVVAPFIVRRLAAQFVHRAPGEAMVQRIAQRFRASRYDLRGVMRDLFLSPEFADAAAYRATVRSPIEFMVAAARHLGAPQLARQIPRAAADMGQELFDPPSVGGWPRNEAWISTTAMIARINWVETALGQVRTFPASRELHRTLFDGVVGPATAEVLASAPDDRTRWAAALTAAEFHLK